MARQVVNTPEDIHGPSKKLNGVAMVSYMSSSATVYPRLFVGILSIQGLHEMS